MLVSMTGYGQGEASNKTSRVTAEIRTVNHRYLDLSIKLPKVLSSREHEIKDLLKDHIQRGRISITITVDSAQPEYDVRLNDPLMEQYLEQLRRFAKKHAIPGDIDINTLAVLPEIFHLQEHESDTDVLWPLVKKSMKLALDECAKMRRDEGKALEVDMRNRVAIMARLTAKVEKRAEKLVTHHSDVLKARVEKLMEGARVDRDRWLAEVAILADRLDYTEETTRLRSHLQQIKQCLDDGGAVSKKLTYLLQEVHREATTITSKASDAEVIQEMISLKEESERLREQVQNLE